MKKSTALKLLILHMIEACGTSTPKQRGCDCDWIPRLDDFIIYFDQFIFFVVRMQINHAKVVASKSIHLEWMNFHNFKTRLIKDDLLKSNRQNHSINLSNNHDQNLFVLWHIEEDLRTFQTERCQMATLFHHENNKPKIMISNMYNAFNSNMNAQLNTWW